MSSIIKSSRVIKSHSKSKVQKVEESNNYENIKNSILNDAYSEANKIINHAKKEATEIIKDAQREKENLLNEAYEKSAQITEEARQRGYDEGYLEGKKASDELIEEANQYKREYFMQKEKLIQEVEEDVINLVIDISHKVFGDFVLENKEFLLSVVSKGINSLNAREKVTIRVSPEDYDFVEMSKDRILVMANLVEDIDIKSDNSLEVGGCIIETSKGNVDASLQTQIREIEELLRNLLNSE